MVDLDLEKLAKVSGVLVTAVVAILLYKKKRRDDAATIFRDSLLRHFNGLYPQPVSWPANVDHKLRELFPGLQEAVASYRPFVRDKSGFDDAWLTYRSAYKREVDLQCYHHYMDFTSIKGTLDGPVTEVTDGKGNFKANVGRLLQFAD